MSQLVRIVLPDTGPLITLAQADSLDLLLAFNPGKVRIVLTDLVEFECTRHRSDHPDAQRIADFLQRNAHRVEIQSTVYGQQVISGTRSYEAFQSDPKLQAAYAAAGLKPPPGPVADSGEVSISGYVHQLIGQPPGPPCLIIAEDDYFLRASPGALPGNARIISTMAYLLELERLEPKFSAKAVMKQAAAFKDRVPNPAQVDTPAQKITGGAAWSGAIDSAAIAQRMTKQLGLYRGSKSKKPSDVKKG